MTEAQAEMKLGVVEMGVLWINDVWLRLGEARNKKVIIAISVSPSSCVNNMMMMLKHAQTTRV